MSDNEMHSPSSPDVDSEEVMFPNSSSTGHAPGIPSTTAASNSSRNTTSSPVMPFSQAFTSLMDDQPRHPITVPDGSRVLDGATGEPSSSSAGRTTGGGDEEEKSASASASSVWKTERAKADFARESEKLLDRDFSLKAFGDPFDESDMAIPK